MTNEEDNLNDCIRETKKRINRQQSDSDEENIDDMNPDVFAEELLENAVEALYTSSGKSIADVLDNNLNKLNKILLGVQKTQVEIKTILSKSHQSKGAVA